MRRRNRRRWIVWLFVPLNFYTGWLGGPGVFCASFIYTYMIVTQIIDAE